METNNSMGYLQRNNNKLISYIKIISLAYHGLRLQQFLGQMFTHCHPSFDLIKKRKAEQLAKYFYHTTKISYYNRSYFPLINY